MPDKTQEQTDEQTDESKALAAMVENDSQDPDDSPKDPDLDDLAPDDPPSDPSDSEPEDVPDELIQEMKRAYNYWHTHGYPEKASVLWECIQQRRRPPANLLPGSTTGVRPETAIDPGKVSMPPRHGPNASHDAWRAFAKKVINMEPEIIDALGREEIISILEDKKVIEKKVEAASNSG